MTGARVVARQPPLRWTGAMRLALFGTLLGGGAAVLWLAPLHGAVRPAATTAVPWWAELIACYVAGLLTVQYRLGRLTATVSLAEVPLAVGLFMVDPHVLLGCYAAGALAAHITRRGLHPVRDYSNLMVDAVTVGVAVLVFAAIGPDPHAALAPRSLLALAAAMAAQGWVIAPAVTGVGTLLFQGRLRPAEAMRSALSQMMATTVDTCIGIAGLLFVTTQPLLLLVLIPPALLVLLAQSAVGESQRRAERIEFLFHAGEILHSTSRLDDRAKALLGSMITAFGMSRVELLLVPELRDAAVRFGASAGEPGVAVISSDLTYAEQEMLNALRARRMISGAQRGSTTSPLGLLLGERGASFGTVVSLRGGERPQGMLLLLDPLDADSAPVGLEADLLLSLAQQISTALESGQLSNALRSLTRERDEATRRAFYDPLTQIANRSLFEETVTRALARLGTSRRPLAIMVIDIDGFQDINDAHGQPVGDQVLSAVAARLRAQIRKFDMVARLGGDEFGILLDGMRRRADVHIVASRVVETLRAPIMVETASLRAGASVGIAVVDEPASAPPVDELLRRADMAMYLAKRQGKDRYVVFDTGARETIIAAQAVGRPRTAAVG